MAGQDNAHNPAAGDLLDLHGVLSIDVLIENGIEKILNFNTIQGKILGKRGPSGKVTEAVSITESGRNDKRERILTRR